jgi:hypothetical protein
VSCIESGAKHALRSKKSFHTRTGRRDNSIGICRTISCVLRTSGINNDNDRYDLSMSFMAKSFWKIAPSSLVGLDEILVPAFGFQKAPTMADIPPNANVLDELSLVGIRSCISFS